MTALHVVGEDFELRLVIGFGGFRQQQRLCHHLGVGLLRIGRTMILPWKTLRLSSSSTDLNNSRLAQSRMA